MPIRILTDGEIMDVIDYNSIVSCLWVCHIAIGLSQFITHAYIGLKSNIDDNIITIIYSEDIIRNKILTCIGNASHSKDPTFLVIIIITICSGCYKYDMIIT